MTAAIVAIVLSALVGATVALVVHVIREEDRNGR